MGSRKKKMKISDREKFFSWYRSLSIMDKIAYKSYLFNYCRARIRLEDLFNYPYFWIMRPIGMRRAIESGYNIKWQ
jgi:hypothetical protein